ncbi:MAG: DUF1292 domain-containing protein [Clostridiales Family XIII bacterium]|jgi:transcriptional antiterminator Rof (Rho-off)|nr:DUF1292 domain-containing protein [Clostridiales Family XIII bacterium]
MAGNDKKDDIQEDDSLIITLEFDDGSEVESEALGVFEVDGQEYIALAPNDGTDDVYIYRYTEIENTDEFELIDIDDEAEFEKAVSVFDELMSEE